MTIDNGRKPEASALRLLFHEQWTHFLQLVEERDKLQQTDRQKSAEIAKAIETVVTGTDARIRSVGGYKKRLRDSVRVVIDYVEALVDGLPAAIAVNQHTFASDPLVNSFFVNKTDIQQIFSRCQKLHAFFGSTEHRQLQEVYALLFVQKSEKTTFGKKLQGDMILSDVMQTSVSFSDHQILSPGATEELVRKSLEALLFDSVLNYIKIHMTRLRYQQSQDEQQHKNLSMDKSLRNPEVYLQKLIEHLNEPMELLQQQESMLKISKMHILLSEENTDTANELHLNTVKVGDLPPRIIALVRYPKSEMLPIKTMFEV